MHDDIIKMFKKNIPRQKKVYQTYLQDCKVQNFSYNNFKNNNVILIEFKDFIMSIEEYYYLSTSQIDNIFEYLQQNLSFNNFTKIKKVYKLLNCLSDYLSERYNSKDSLHGETSKSNCLYMINKITDLKTFIATKKNYNVLEIEKIISFENVIKQLLNPKEYVFDERKLLFLIDNFSFILNNDRNNQNFNYNFCKCIEKAKINRDREKLNYYKNMYNYLSTIKELELDNEYISFFFFFYIQKIDSMRIDAKTGNRIVDDYILSIDNDITRKIDDAFSIEKINNNYLLGIHIADVYSLGYFEEESWDVNQKGYIKKADASLSRNKKRNAMSMYVLVDSNGIIRKFKIINTVLKADANLVYEDIPHLIRNENINPELKNTVINLLSVYNLLENSRFPNNPSINNFAYLITSKLMMLCCTLYSEEFKNKEIPAIYLCGDSKSSFYSMDSSDYYTGFDKYNTYARVTSPIYDKASLINQYVINRYMLQKRFLNEEDKEEMCLKLEPIIDKLNKNKDIDCF